MGIEKEVDNTNIDIGGRIKLQRESIGLTQNQLARGIGVTRNTIVNYENGRTEPSTKDLVKITNTLGCRIMDMFSEKHSEQAPKFAFRAHKKLKRDPKIIAKARKYLNSYIEIEEITNSKIQIKIPQYDCFSERKENPDRWLEIAACDVKEKCGGEGLRYENISKFLENIGIRPLFFKSNENGIDALSVLYDDMALMMIRDRAVERTIFSVAHELAHLVLHPHLFTDKPDDTENDRDYEKEADIFAGYFLVPNNELYRIWQQEHLDRLPIYNALILLKRYFGVSFWCLFRRLAQEGFTKISYQTLIIYVKRNLGIRGKTIMENLEPDPIQGSTLNKSYRFGRLIYAAFVNEEISVSKVAEMFQIRIDEAQEMTGRWLNNQSEMVA